MLLSVDILVRNHRSIITSNHKFLLRNSNPFTPQLTAVARMFNIGAIRGPNFFPKLNNALATVPTPFAVSFTAFLPAITTVVMMPAMDIAIAENPIRFSLAHCLNLSNLLKSFSRTSSLMIFKVSL